MDAVEMVSILVLMDLSFLPESFLERKKKMITVSILVLMDLSFLHRNCKKLWNLLR